MGLVPVAVALDDLSVPVVSANGLARPSVRAKKLKRVDTDVGAADVATPEKLVDQLMRRAPACQVIVVGLGALKLWSS